MNYAYYSLNVEVNDQAEKEKIIKVLRMCSPDALTCMSSTGCSIRSVKWPEREEEMRALSLKFPGILFHMGCQDIEDSYEWSEYYKDGKMAVIEPKLVWPEFKEEMLAL